MYFLVHTKLFLTKNSTESKCALFIFFFGKVNVYMI